MVLKKAGYKLAVILLITLLFADSSALARVVAPSNSVAAAVACEDVNKKGQPVKVKKLFNPSEKSICIYIKYRKPYSGYINGTLYLVEQKNRRVMLAFKQKGDARTDRFIFRIMNNGKFQYGSYAFEAIWSGKKTIVNFAVSNSGVTSQARLNQPDPQVVALVRQLTAGKATDMEKVRAIHNWVAQNIEYDIEGARTRRYEESAAVRVLQRRKGICAGYSNLISSMLDAAGVKNRIIEGWARHSDETWADLLGRSTEANHAWNEAYVGGRWLIIDSTWDAGYTSDDLSIFNKQFSLKYFDPNPAYFALGHSQVKPAALPQNPNDYYFCFKPDEMDEVTEKATNYLRENDTRYAYGSIWWSSEGISGRSSDGVTAAYVLLSTQKQYIGQECVKVTLNRVNGEWVGVSSEVFPAGQYLYTGGYRMP